MAPDRNLHIVASTAGGRRSVVAGYHRYPPPCVCGVMSPCPFTADGKADAEFHPATELDTSDMAAVQAKIRKGGRVTDRLKEAWNASAG